MLKIKAWISAARLRTLPLSVSGILTGSAVAIEVGAFSQLILYLALATTLGFQILSNFANDYGDGVKGTDNSDRIGPKRALQSGLLSATELKRGMILTAVITLILASMLVFAAFGNDHIFYSLLFFNLGIVAVIAAVKYTVGDSAYGYRALGDLFVFLFFGLLGVVGSYFLYTQALDHYIVLPAITIGLLSTAVLNLNNMRDRLTDAKVSKNTLAVAFGEPNVKHYHASVILIAFCSAVLYFYLNESATIAYLPLLAFVPLFINILKVYRNSDPKKLDPELKKVALSTFLFSVLFLITSLV
jgi:1,4-dihydroxy-2-naphthoate octaprenyltransferase